MKQMIMKVKKSINDGIPVHGTKIVKGYKLILIISDDANGKVMAIEGVKVDQKPLLPFYLPVPTFDEDGEQTGTEKLTDLTGKLQTFAGHSWTYA